MTALLHRLGFVCKKPKSVPDKADRKAQEAFLADYDKLKQDKGEMAEQYAARMVSRRGTAAAGG